MRTFLHAYHHVVESPAFIQSLPYSYLSLKEGERTRRAGSSGTVHLAEMSKDVPVPQQMEKFCLSSENKPNLQILIRQVAAKPGATSNVVLVLSGMIVEEEMVPSLLVQGS